MVQRMQYMISHTCLMVVGTSTHQLAHPPTSKMSMCFGSFFLFLQSWCSLVSNPICVVLEAGVLLVCENQRLIIDSWGFPSFHLHRFRSTTIPEYMILYRHIIPGGSLREFYPGKSPLKVSLENLVPPWSRFWRERLARKHRLEESGALRHATWRLPKRILSGPTPVQVLEGQPRAKASFRGERGTPPRYLAAP